MKRAGWAATISVLAFMSGGVAEANEQLEKQWVARVHAAMLAKARYPAVAAGSGTASYTLTIERDGSRSYGHVWCGMRKAFERAVVDIMETAKFPPIPQGLDAPRKVNGEIDFHPDRTLTLR